MRGSQLCLQLLLAWALLVGPLVSGEEEVVEEEEEVVEEVAAQEDVPEVDDLEVPETQEDYPRGHFMNMQYWHLDERAEERAEDMRRLMTEYRPYGNHMMDSFKLLVRNYMKEKERKDVIHWEDANIQVKKPIGNIVYIRMPLVEINCAEEVPLMDHPGAADVLSSHHFSDDRFIPRECEIPPEAEQQKWECSFTIFMDERSGESSVLSHLCIHPDLWHRIEKYEQGDEVSEQGDEVSEQGDEVSEQGDEESE